MDVDGNCRTVTGLMQRANHERFQSPESLLGDFYAAVVKSRLYSTSYLIRLITIMEMVTLYGDICRVQQYAVLRLEFYFADTDTILWRTARITCLLIKVLILKTPHGHRNCLTAWTVHNMLRSVTRRKVAIFREFSKKDGRKRLLILGEPRNVNDSTHIESGICAAGQQHHFASYFPALVH